MVRPYVGRRVVLDVFGVDGKATRRRFLCRVVSCTDHGFLVRGDRYDTFVSYVDLYTGQARFADGFADGVLSNRTRAAEPSGDAARE